MSQLLVRGRDTEVRLVAPGVVARTYHDRARSAAVEAQAMVALWAAGFPCPRVLDVEGPTIHMELIAGPSMAEAMAADRATAASLMRVLVALHHELHELPPPAVVRREFPEGSSVLHLDLHPQNVMLSSDGPVVLDWTTVCVGPADLDLAQTWLLLDVAPNPLGSGPLPLVVRKVLIDLFVEHLDRDAVAVHLPRLAARRLAEREVGHAERLALERVARGGTTQGIERRRPRWRRTDRLRPGEREVLKS